MNKKMKLQELKKLMKDNNIRFAYFRKSEIIKKLIEHKVLPKDYTEPRKDKDYIKLKKYKAENVNEEKRLNSTRNNPRKVEITNLETGEVIVFPSIYKAGRFFERSHGTIVDNSVRKKKYKIKVFFKTQRVRKL